MKCPTCESCEYEQYCGATEIMRKCERHNKKVKQTNEEWFCSLPTKEKAKEMCVIMADMAEANDGVWDEEMIEEWLKEEHHD